MFAHLLEQLFHRFECAERRHLNYLASSSDLAELERRMRSVDVNDYPG